MANSFPAMAVATLPPRTQHCFFFDIPAELRLNIYEHACTNTVADTDGAVLLTAAQPPSNAVLPACQQTYTEARKVYRRAYRAFWETNTFVVRHEQLRILETLLAHISDVDMAAIQHLEFRVPHYTLKWNGRYLVSFAHGKPDTPDGFLVVLPREAHELLFWLEEDGEAASDPTLKLKSYYIENKASTRPDLPELLAAWESENLPNGQSLALLERLKGLEPRPLTKGMVVKMAEWLCGMDGGCCYLWW